MGPRPAVDNSKMPSGTDDESGSGARGFASVRRDASSGCGVPDPHTFFDSSQTFATNLADFAQAVERAMTYTTCQMENMAAMMSTSAPLSVVNSEYRGLKPKKDLVSITAISSRQLMTELYQLEVDLDELGIPTKSEAGYRQLRAQCQDRARTVLDLLLVIEPGLSLHDRLRFMVQNRALQAQRDAVAAQLYTLAISALEEAARLAKSHDVTCARRHEREEQLDGVEGDIARRAQREL